MLQIDSALKYAFDTNKVYALDRIEVNDLTEPWLMGELTLKSYVDDLSNRLQSGGAVTQSKATAVADAITSVIVTGNAFAIKFSLLSKKLDSLLPSCSGSINWTDTDGTTHSRAIKLEPTPDGVSDPSIVFFLLKITSGFRQAAINGTGNIQVTFAANELYAGTVLQVRTFVKKDLDIIKMSAGLRSYNVPRRNIT